MEGHGQVGDAVACSLCGSSSLGEGLVWPQQCPVPYLLCDVLLLPTPPLPNAGKSTDNDGFTRWW